MECKRFRTGVVMANTRSEQTNPLRDALKALVDQLSKDSRPEIIKSIVELIIFAKQNHFISRNKEINFAYILGTHLNAQEFAEIALTFLKENLPHEVISLLNNYKCENSPSLLIDMKTQTLLELINHAEDKNLNDVVKAFIDEVERAKLLRGPLLEILAPKMQKNSTGLQASKDLAVVMAENNVENERLRKEKEELLHAHEKLELSHARLKKLLEDEKAKLDKLRELNVQIEKQALKDLAAERDNANAVKDELSHVKVSLQATQTNADALEAVAKDLVRVNQDLTIEARRKKQEINDIKGGVVIKGSFTMAGLVGGAVLGFVLFPPFGALIGAAVGGFLGLAVGTIVNKVDNYLRRREVTRASQPASAGMVNNVTSTRSVSPARTTPSVSQPEIVAIGQAKGNADPVSDRGEEGLETNNTKVGSPEITPVLSVVAQSKDVSSVSTQSIFAHKEEKAKARVELPAVDDDLDNVIGGGIRAVKATGNSG